MENWVNFASSTEVEAVSYFPKFLYHFERSIEVFRDFGVRGIRGCFPAIWVKAYIYKGTFIKCDVMVILVSKMFHGSILARCLMINWCLLASMESTTSIEDWTRMYWGIYGGYLPKVIWCGVMTRRNVLMCCDTIQQVEGNWTVGMVYGAKNSKDIIHILCWILRFVHQFQDGERYSCAF